MKEIGRRIYYDKFTGIVIQDTGECRGLDLIERSVVDDFLSYNALFDRTQDSVGYIQLEYGQYAQDFSESNGYRVDIATKQLVFSYPDPSDPEAPPVFQLPLSDKVASLESELATYKARTEDVELMLTEIIFGGM